jgi:hypothetical protein
MSRLPPPTTFAEGMRLLFAIAALVAGIAFGVGLTVLVALLVWGGWPATLYPKILDILGYVAIGALALIGITQVGILLGGPVGRFKAAVGKEGATVEGDSASATIAAVAQGAAAGAAAGAVSATTQEKTP